MLKERNTPRGFVEAAQIDAICAALPEPLRPVVRFAFATGWRTKSEVLPLEWRNVDWVGCCVRLNAHTTKNTEAREFPFTAQIETLLKDQLVEHERLKAAGRIVPQVFHRDGKPIANSRRAWEAACAAAGCPGQLIHDMRRSAVRIFERAGIPRSAAMAAVGHKTESIYRRYAIVDQKTLREMGTRLDAFAAAPEPGAQTRTVSAFNPKVARVTKPRSERSA
jgi:integrase